ncbi:MAG: MotA/TolQ/ExbB proton channel family protein [Ghiorsea sp.]
MDLFNNFNSLMDRGGPVMWVIFVAASVAIIMLIERAIQIFKWLKLAETDQGFAHKASVDDLKNIQGDKMFRQQSPLRSVLQQLRWSEARSEDDLTKQINTLLSELMPKLNGLLPTIAVIGTLLPMLGLLGTVTGMINVFEVIALHGTGDPQEMAHGISQALLTTASGLVIAIPVIFFHHVLAQRLQVLLVTTEQSLQVVLAKVKF